ncbi:MAG: dTMP kinase [Alphaproteobacteria bacterium HGW-Alphaproteobacteria-14]|nr:MAG: dTMP kinase [Alphaproteobacteria bacterium HGW-Alphaproteobacteria-14]
MTGGRGAFIAFEGGEGAGKSTQARLLAEALRARGLKVVTTREPGGTPGAEAIRDLLLSPPGAGWTAEAEALLFAAARADHVANLIRPALARGEWVLCDRFVDSSRAYQGGAGGLGDDAILGLHDFGSSGMRPDLVILLEGDEAALAARLAARDGDTSDAIGGRPADYHRAVAAAFRALAERDPDSFAKVEAIGDPLAVHQRVITAVAPLIEGARA